MAPQSAWPAAVALGIIVLVGAIAVAGITEYEIEEFLKIWAALNGLIGVITGAIGAFFFTRGIAAWHRNQADEASRRAALAEARASAASDAVSRIFYALSPEQQQQAKDDPVIRRWFEG